MTDAPSKTSQMVAPQEPPPHMRLGALGESIAAQYLEAQGYEILARNWRDGARGEIDIVARHHQAIVAVEVKTRSGTGFGHPLESITSRKGARLRRLIAAWARSNTPRADELRVDGIGIVIRSGRSPRIDHVRGVG